MRGKARDAFDLSREDDRVRGSTARAWARSSQARRLAEAGVQAITVWYGG